MEDAFDRDLVKDYNPNSIKSLHSASNYLGIKSLNNVIYIKIGTEIFINTNKVGSLNAIKEKYNINGDYTI